MDVEMNPLWVPTPHESGQRDVSATVPGDPFPSIGPGFLYLGNSTQWAEGLRISPEVAVPSRSIQETRNLASPSAAREQQRAGPATTGPGAAIPDNQWSAVRTETSYTGDHSQGGVLRDPEGTTSSELQGGVTGGSAQTGATGGGTVPMGTGTRSNSRRESKDNASFSGLGLCEATSVAALDPFADLLVSVSGAVPLARKSADWTNARWSEGGADEAVARRDSRDAHGLTGGASPNGTSHRTADSGAAPSTTPGVASVASAPLGAWVAFDPNLPQPHTQGGFSKTSAGDSTQRRVLDRGVVEEGKKAVEALCGGAGLGFRGSESWDALEPQASLQGSGSVGSRRSTWEWGDWAAAGGPDGKEPETVTAPVNGLVPQTSLLDL